MRIVGLSFISRNEADYRGNHFQKDKKYSKTLLAIGDSFTYAGNVNMSQSFPFLLHNIQDESNKYRYKIINGGWCEENTFTAMPRLAENLAKYKPDIVLILLGAADRFNLIGHDTDYKFSFETNHLEDNTLIENLKIYKMYKNIKLNIEYKGLYCSIFTCEETRIFTDIRNLDDYINLKFAHQNLLRGEIKKANDYLALLSSTKDSIWKVDENTLHDPKKKFEYRSNVQELIENIQAKYYRNKEYEKMIDFHLDFMENFTRLLLEEDSYNNLHRLVLAFDFQSTYDANYILKKFNSILDKFTDLREISLVKLYLKTFSNKEEFRKKINTTRKENLQKIISYIQKNNATPILQTYPIQFSDINKIIYEVARENNLEVIDHAQEFKKIITNENLKSYFEDDEHPTPSGYKFMAQVIWNYLEKNPD